MQHHAERTLRTLHCDNAASLSLRNVKQRLVDAAQPPSDLHRELPHLQREGCTAAHTQEAVTNAHKQEAVTNAHTQEAVTNAHTQEAVTNAHTREHKQHAKHRPPLPVCCLRLGVVVR
jgi:hypothetical protein